MMQAEKSETYLFSMRRAKLGHKHDIPFNRIWLYVTLLVTQQLIQNVKGTRTPYIGWFSQLLHI